jgi:hypothetical protein
LPTSRGKNLELAEVSVARARCWVAAGPEQMRGLVVQSECLHWRDHRATAAACYEQCFLSHLARQCARKRMVKQLHDSLGVASQQRSAKGIQKRQHGDSVVFGVIYTL